MQVYCPFTFVVRSKYVPNLDHLFVEIRCLENVGFIRNDEPDLAKVDDLLSEAFEEHVGSRTKNSP